MPLDKIALVLVVIAVAVWCAVLLTGVIATLPWGLPLLLVFCVVAYLFYRVVRERLHNAEDDHYEKNVKQ
jgi:membrane protein implicated in regulation of membrane protease activity